MEEGRYKAIADCSRFGAELEDHLEGEPRPFIASHAQACTVCNALLEDLNAIRIAARELPQEAPSPAVWANVHQAMVSERGLVLAACAQFSDALETHLEGEPQPFVLAHARSCQSCNLLLEDLTAIQAAARALPEVEPSPAVWANIQKSLATEAVLAGAACAQFSVELESHLEDEASPFIVSHAESCPSCHSLLQDLQAIALAARSLPLAEPSPAVWANIVKAIEPERALAAAACSQFATEMEAYLEGDSRPFVASHAQACQPCAAVLADLEAIREAAGTLPQEEPSRVVWANVRARLEAEGAFRNPSRGWRQLFSWPLSPQLVPFGALAGFVVLGAILSLPSGSLQTMETQQATVAIPTATEEASLTPPPEDVSLAHVVTDLETNFKANESSMTPDLKATYEKSLVSLDGSIRECLDSLHQEPRNTLAHDYLLTAYTRKAEVLSSALEFEGR